MSYLAVLKNPSNNPLIRIERWSTSKI